MAKQNIKVIYDSSRELINQINALCKENKEVPKDLLDALEKVYMDIVEYEKIYLIQCEDQFWGSILLNIDLTINYNQRGPIDLNIQKDPYELSFNPLFCAKYTFSEFTGLIVDTLIKMVWLHPIEYHKLNPDKDESTHKMLDAASSCASTSILQRDIRLSPKNLDYSVGSSSSRLPPDLYTRSKLESENKISTADAMNTEYYYNIIKRLRKDNDSDGNGGSGTGGGSQSNSNSIASPDNSSGNSTHQWEGGDESEDKEKMISFLSDVYNNLSDKSRGYMPGSVMTQLEKLFKPPEINWKQVLKKLVGTIPVPYRKTRTRLNRRQPERADLCGKLLKRTVNIVCCFDTSGSMSDNDLKYCMNEVFNIVKNYEGYEITVIEADYEVQHIYTAKKLSDLSLKMHGRGGTSFIPTINYINGEEEFRNNPKFPKAGKYKDALLVYFTDGYGDYEIPKPRTYKNLWVVLGDERNLSVKEPYGEVKSLKGDPDFRK